MSFVCTKTNLKTQPMWFNHLGPQPRPRHRTGSPEVAQGQRPDYRSDRTLWPLIPIFAPRHTQSSVFILYLRVSKRGGGPLDRGLQTTLLADNSRVPCGRVIPQHVRVVSRAAAAWGEPPTGLGTSGDSCFLEWQPL